MGQKGLFLVTPLNFHLPIFNHQVKFFFFFIMNRGRGRGRGGRQSNVSRTVNAAVRREAKHDAGQSFTPAIMPPDFARIPWHPFTFSATLSGDGQTGTISVTTLRGTIIGICGISNTAKVEIKVERARVWNISKGGTDGFSMPNLVTKYYELAANNAGTQAVRVFRNDHGTLNLPAKTGYVWPLRDRCEVLSNDDDLDVMSINGPTGTNIVVMINLLYRSLGSAALDYFAPSVRKGNDATDSGFLQSANEPVCENLTPDAH